MFEDSQEDFSHVFLFPPSFADMRRKCSTLCFSALLQRISNLRRILFTGFPFEYFFLLLLMYDNIIYKLLKCITWYFDTYISKLKIQCYNQSAQLSCRNHCRINCKTWLIKIHSFNIQKYILKVFEKWFVYLYILVNRRKEDNIRI